MNWKKWMKYIGITFLALLLITPAVLYFGLESSMKQMYGANTKMVDVTQFSPETGTVVVKNVNILSTDSEQFINGQTVLLDNGLIQQIGDEIVIPAQAKVVDGQGKYLIPGLIDSHVHIFYSPNDLLLYIANGVTEIREMMGSEGRLALKREIENGRIGPKLWVASPPLGTVNDFQSWFISWTRQAKNLDNAEEAEAAIHSFVEKGYDGVKIYSHINKESYLAATKTATELDFPIVGHIPWDISLSEFWESGQNEVGHIEEVMNALRREFGYIDGREAEFLEFVREQSDVVAENLIQRNIPVTSTMCIIDGLIGQKFELERVLREAELSYVNVGMLEGVQFGDNGFGWLPHNNLYKLPAGLTTDEIAGHRKFWEVYSEACEILIEELSKKGVTILAGTDANIPATVPGFSLHEELINLEEAGMSNAAILQSVTAKPAAFMRSNTGKITEGYAANLVLLDKNPLEDIRHTESINTVFANGKMYGRALLDEMLAAVKAANDEGRTIDISEYEVGETVTLEE
ncbi:MAG: amidohydrolase family protein [Bacteroidota bacterium]